MKVLKKIEEIKGCYCEGLEVETGVKCNEMSLLESKLSQGGKREVEMKYQSKNKGGRVQRIHRFTDFYSREREIKVGTVIRALTRV